MNAFLLAALAALLGPILDTIEDKPEFDHVPGMAIRFESVHAAFAATEVQQHLMNYACEGLLRLDAIRGEDLSPEARAKLDVFAAEGWYGIIPGLLAVGPFERKSQAMNGLVLTLAGLDVVPTYGRKLAEQQHTEPAAAEEEQLPEGTTDVTPAGYAVDFTHVPPIIKDVLMARIDAQLAGQGVDPAEQRRTGLPKVTIQAI